MLEQIDQTALKLEAIGIAPGDRVAILGPNNSVYPVLIAACWRLGAVVVPLSTRYPSRKIAEAVTNLACKTLLHGTGSLKPIPGISTRRIDEVAPPCRDVFGGVRLDQLKIDQANDAAIIMTSGSLGQSKGVLSTISNHYHNALGANENTPFAKRHRWLMSLPMYHISGLSLLMRALLHGGEIIFPQAEEPLQQSLISHDITHLSVVPFQLSQLLDIDECADRLRSLDVILVGGSSTPQSLIERSLSLDLPIHTTYGSTEMASQITTTAQKDPSLTTGSSGKALPWRRVSIADDGEILVKGSCLFKGYVQNSRTTLPLDADGFFHTSDAGRMDDQGNLHVRGRKDLMFISGGENIFPSEIEQRLESIETVERAIVVPVTREPMGHRPVAFVKMRYHETLDAKVLQEKLRENLEGFKVPVAFFAWPKDIAVAGKPDRSRFKTLANKLDGRA